MTILVVVERFYPYAGGVEKMFLLLCRGLHDAGHRVKVVCGAYGPLPEHEPLPFEVHYVPSRNRLHFASKAMPVVKRLAADAQLLHTTSYAGALPAFAIGTWLKIPVVITFHEYIGRSWWSLPFLNWPAKLAFRTAERILVTLPFDATIAVSQFTFKRLQPVISEQKLRMIYNGLTAPISPAFHEPPATPHFVYIGRLGVTKGIDVLIQAIVTAPAAWKFTLVVPEQDGLFPWLKKTLRMPLQNGQVQLLHSITDAELQTLLQHSTAVVVPSHSEGFGFVAAEAAVLGVPLVHSGRGALPEVVSGKHIVMSHYSCDGLLKALEQASAGDFSMTQTRDFSSTEMVKNYAELYAEVLSNNDSKRRTN